MVVVVVVYSAFVMSVGSGIREDGTFCPARRFPPSHTSLDLWSLPPHDSRLKHAVTCPVNGSPEGMKGTKARTIRSRDARARMMSAAAPDKSPLQATPRRAQRHAASTLHQQPARPGSGPRDQSIHHDDQDDAGKLSPHETQAVGCPLRLWRPRRLQPRTSPRHTSPLPSHETAG